MLSRIGKWLTPCKISWLGPVSCWRFRQDSILPRILGDNKIFEVFGVFQFLGELAGFVFVCKFFDPNPVQRGFILTQNPG